MDACVDSLYTLDGDTDKRKTLEMIRVMKGAISVSKSRTGECIYRYNRHEKKYLNKTLAKYDRDVTRTEYSIDCQKREVLRKWSIVFGRQRSFCESMRNFDDMVAMAIECRGRLREEVETKDDLEKKRDTEDKEEEAEEEKPPEEEIQEVPDRRRGMPAVVMDPRSRNQANANANTSVSFTPGVLPKLPPHRGGFFAKSARTGEEEEEERRKKEEQEEEERRKREKTLPSFDKEKLQGFIAEQKSLQEDLLTRNTLSKLKKNLDHGHIFFKHRIKASLPDSAFSLISRIEHERAASRMTRASTAATAIPRLPRSSQHSIKSFPGDVAASEPRSAPAAQKKQRESISGAKTPTPEPVGERPTFERAKTVHFT